MLTAFEDISVSVRRGEFVALVGPSGCGKSSLLRVVAGLADLSSGSCAVAGQPMSGPRRDIGIVFQSPLSFPWRTVMENVLIPVDVQKLGRDRCLPAAKKLLELVGLAEFENAYPHPSAFEENKDSFGTISHGYTYSAHPVGAAAALACLPLMEKAKVAENAAARGDELLAGCLALKNKHEIVGDVRGKGLMVAIELVSDVRRSNRSTRRSSARSSSTSIGKG